MLTTEHPNTPPPGFSYWDDYPGLDEEDWMREVENGDTRAGYWQWVRAGLEDN